MDLFLNIACAVSLVIGAVDLTRGSGIGVAWITLGFILLVGAKVISQLEGISALLKPKPGTEPISENQAMADSRAAKFIATALKKG